MKFLNHNFANKGNDIVYGTQLKLNNKMDSCSSTIVTCKLPNDNDSPLIPIMKVIMIIHKSVMTFVEFHIMLRRNSIKLKKQLLSSTFSIPAILQKVKLVKTDAHNCFGLTLGR